MPLSPNPHILYVDDNNDACQLIEVMFRCAHSPCRISTVTSPFEALSLIKAEKIDLYILDYALPGMSGVELCRRIRETDSHTPILFFSGLAFDKDKMDAIKAGANEYLTKPNDIDRLTDTAEQLLSEKPCNSKRNYPNTQNFCSKNH